MLGDNLLSLRKMMNLTQEEVADRIGVTRQALSKWENNDTTPDIVNCKKLADFYEVSLDTLVNFDRFESEMEVPRNGKHMCGVVTINAKGQIVIPRRAREVFSLSTGDRLIVLGDEESGIAIMKEKTVIAMMESMQSAAISMRETMQNIEHMKPIDE